MDDHSSGPDDNTNKDYQVFLIHEDEFAFNSSLLTDNNSGRDCQVALIHFPFLTLFYLVNLAHVDGSILI